MNKIKSIKQVPSSEIQSVIGECKAKLYNHIEMRQEHQVNQTFVSYLERQIEELSKELKQRVAA